MTDLNQQSTNLAHSLLIVYLLQELALQKTNPKEFLSSIEKNLVCTLPTLKAIKEGPPQMQGLVTKTVSSLIDVASRGL